MQVYTVCWVGDNHLLVGGSQQNKAVLVDASRDWVKIPEYVYKSFIFIHAVHCKHIWDGKWCV